MCHLNATRVGTGPRKMDLGQSVDRPTPSDCVLTCSWHMYQGDLSAPMETEMSELWRSSDEASVKRLLKKFGEAPKQL